MNSGNFKCLMLDDNIDAVFCLTGRSTLLVETAGRTDLDATILDAVTDAPLPLKGVLGEWHSALAVWRRLLRTGAIVERYRSRELLYELALPRVDDVGSESDDVRLLRPEDFQQWLPVRTAFLAEEGLPVQGTLDQQRATFEEQTTAHRYWGYFEKDQLLATVALNATYKGTGQVGGVFTVAQRRREGLSRWAMRSLFADSIRLHELSRLVLFTGRSPAALRVPQLQASWRIRAAVRRYDNPHRSAEPRMSAQGARNADGQRVSSFTRSAAHATAVSPKRRALRG